MHSTYQSLIGKSRHATVLESVGELLTWDQETHMPAGAATIRAEQRKALAAISHEARTSADFERELGKLIDIEHGVMTASGLGETERACVQLWHRDFVRSKKLPSAFVQECAQLSSEALMAWQKAKEDDAFDAFAPYLARQVEMAQKKAELWGYANHPYDALLNDYEPGCTTAMLDPLFGELKTAITAMLKKVPSRPVDADKVRALECSKEDQLAICRIILDLIGFNWSTGRLDVSCHPFCSSFHPTDSRITTRVDSHGVISQVLTIMHEAGHSFYETGLPQEHYGTPLGQACSMGIHECQSRFWETRIGRSLPFWELFYPILIKRIPALAHAFDLQTLYRHIHHVAPSLIRTDADEVTYPFHVILRYEIEKELIAGTLSAHDLPKRWNAGMEALLGCTPPDFRSGCLQDIHWSMGYFGYFPTYSLGNLYAAQMFETFTRDIPNWTEQIRSGHFAAVKAWLQHHVWQHGRRYDGAILIERICGKPLSSAPFVAYLQEKYC